MTFEDLRRINQIVNQFPYKSDWDAEFGYEADVWGRIDDDGGDCENFAIGKLRRLLDEGWPIDSLRLAFCHTETGEGHVVLLADFEGQTWVLDNRYPFPMEFQELPYTWKKIQVAGSQRWMAYA